MHQLVYVSQNAQEIWDYYLPRLRRLRDEGFHVRIATPFSDALARLEGEGMEIRPLPGANHRNLPGQLGAYAILQGEFLQEPPTLVHSFGRPWAWLGSLAAHRAGVPAVFATIERHRIQRRRSRAAYRQLGQWVTNYIVHHEHDLQRLVDGSIVPSNKLELLLGGRGVDMDVFTPDTDAATGVTAGTRLRVLARDGQRERDAKQWLARRLPNVDWSFAPTSHLELSAADLYLTADMDDFVGHDLMAAAAMRTPVLAVMSDAAKSVVVHRETGHLVAAERLHGELQQMLADPRRLNEMGIRARARAEVRFDRGKVDEQLLRLYDQVLSERMR